MNPPVIPDVAIVGAGPNGLLLAAELALAGVRPIVLERLAEPSTSPKANGLVGRVVQALEYRGLYQLLSGEDGPPQPSPQYVFGALPLDLSGLEDHSLYIFPIPQRRIEELLSQRATESGVPVHRGHEVTAVRQTADAVTVDVLGPDGPYQLVTRYLVAADGGTSGIRKQLGIGFPGITDDRFVSRTGQVGIAAPVAVPDTGELDVPGLGTVAPMAFTRTENGLFVHAMFQPGCYRVGVFEWGAPVLADSDVIPLEEMQDAVRRVLGADVPLTEPPGGQPMYLGRGTGVNSRQADRFRSGRVFLVGDAAHVHSAIGGPGLNLGMQDAFNLAWKLAAAVRGWAPSELLDSYESERRPAGERVLMHTRAQMALLSPGPNVTALRELLSELLADAGTRRRIADLMAGADLRYDARHDGPVHPMTGHWMPDLPLRTGDGATRVAELLRAARPVLLDLAGRRDLSVLAGAWADRVDIVRGSAPDQRADAVLIRPDGYVAWAADADTDGAAEGLRGALLTWFGQPALAGAGVA